MCRKIAIAIALVALAGCGGLSTDSDYKVANALAATAMLCSDQLAGTNIPQREFSAASNGIDTLISIYRSDPRAVYHTDSEGDRTMRQVVSDEASNLSRCDPAGAARLDRAIAAG